MRLSFAIVLIGFGIVLAMIMALLKACYKRIHQMLLKRTRRDTLVRPHIIPPRTGRIRERDSIIIDSNRGPQLVPAVPTLPPAYSEPTDVPEYTPGHLPPPYSDPPPTYSEAVAQKEAAGVKVEEG